MEGHELAPVPQALGKNIHRTRVDSHFTTLPNAVLQDKSLSFRARGVLVMMLSMPENWQTYHKWIRGQGKEGEAALRSAVRELEAAGYVTKRAIRTAGKWTGVHWQWYTEPVPEEKRTAFRKPAVAQKSSGGLTSPEESRSIKDPMQKIPNVQNRESQESASDDAETLDLDFSALWKPVPGTKEEKLLRLSMPTHYPSEAIFDQWLVESELWQIIRFRSDLYHELCRHKFHVWKEDLKKWVPIRDWPTFVRHLAYTIEDAIEPY